MHLGRVIGTVVATRKDANLLGHKLLMVQPVGANLQNDGEAVVAIDHVNSGVGDLVFMVRGKDAAWPIGRNTPVDMGIVAIIDSVDT